MNTNELIQQRDKALEQLEQLKRQLKGVESAIVRVEGLLEIINSAILNCEPAS